MNSETSIKPTGKLNKRNKQSDPMIGSFILDDQAVFFGTVRNNQPEGLGVYFGANGKTKIGYVKDNKFEGLCRVVDKAGLVMYGVCQAGEFMGKSNLFFIDSNSLQCDKGCMEEAENQ